MFLSVQFQNLKKSLAQAGDNCSKIGNGLKDRYGEKQVPLPTDIAKQLSNLKVCIFIVINTILLFFSQIVLFVGIVMT